MARGVGTVLVGILGPTGSGKSRLSITLAKHFDGEVVGCDALQVYRGVDVGTGKLSSAARAGIPHYLLDVVEPDGEFSAADYVREAAPVVRDISRRGKLPLVVGGTGLYFRSLRRGLFEGPGRVPKLRARISRVAGRRGTAYVHRMLCRRDPTSAARIHPNDLVRTIRALEVTLLSSRPMSDVMRERRRPLEGFQFSLVGLSPPREELRRRIDIRVRRMFDEGLVDEVRRLQERYGTEIPAFKAIGYREVGRYLAGALGIDEARQLTLTATLRYAKRQMTWFRKEEGVVWFAGSGDDPGVERAVREHLRSELAKLDSAEETLHAKTAS